MDEAACKNVDPKYFFPERGHTQDALYGQVVCFHCPVFEKCDSYRKNSGSGHGVWAANFIRRDDDS